MTDQVPANPQPEPVPPAWEKTQLARHPQRPDPLAFMERIFTDFSEIHGDRAFGDDPAVTCGMARLDGQEVMVIANLKGRTTKEKIQRRFGMPDPEGYRKALRAMKLAEKFSRPVITLIDLMGANPGLGAEERGQAEAIARNLREMSRLRVPTIAVITGEGGSGGALGLAVADRVLILEKAIYSVISPGSRRLHHVARRRQTRRSRRRPRERPPMTRAPSAASTTSSPNPESGAHTDPPKAAELLAEKLRWHLNELKALPLDELLRRRYEKFRNIAQFYTV